MNSYNTPVTNPMLVSAMELVKGDNSEKHMEFFVNELLQAKFICPVVINPVPEVREDGSFDMPKDAQISFPMITNTQGQKFVMAYTDMAELLRWKKDSKQAVLIFRFSNYAEVVLQEDNPCAGIAVNPFGDNMVIPKELVRKIKDTHLKK